VASWIPQSRQTRSKGKYQSSRQSCGVVIPSDLTMLFQIGFMIPSLYHGASNQHFEVEHQDWQHPAITKPPLESNFFCRIDERVAAGERSKE